MSYLDALVVKFPNKAHVRNKSAHIAAGVAIDGITHVLGIWFQATEGARFWAEACTQLANRGVRDVLIVCCDALARFPEPSRQTWPQSMIQTYVVHLIRATMRFMDYKDHKAVAAVLMRVNQAVNADAPKAALDDFATTDLGQRNPIPRSGCSGTPGPGSSRSWSFRPMLRRVIHTTNSIGSLNYQLRKVIRNRGHFPSDDAAAKLLWLVIGNVADKRT